MNLREILAEEVARGGDEARAQDVRKVTALGVACMEAHGAPQRETTKE